MFEDKLEMSLELTIDGTAVKVPGANIKFLKIRLRPYGFAARFRFWVSSRTKSDELLTPFTGDKLIAVNFSGVAYFQRQEAGVKPLELHGYVTEKALLKELTVDNVHLKGDPVLYRYYEISVADPARVLWGQHFPCDLKVNTGVKALIEANKATGVRLTYDWDKLDETFDINTLPLGGPRNRASFLDFILWYSESLNGVFSYDAGEDTYHLSEHKNSSGDSITMSKLEVEAVRVVFPPTIRYNDRLLNALADTPRRQNTDREEAAADYWRDRLLRMPVSADFDAAFNIVSTRQEIRSHELHLTHARLPHLTYVPGIFVQLEKGLWSDQAFFDKKEYRVRDIFISAHAENTDAEGDHNLSEAVYRIEMRSLLELKSERALNLPPYSPPDFPIYVEGKIVSEQGGDTELTYQIYENPQSGLDQYRIEIPLFDNQKVVAPFEPVYFPGHFYFPAYKGEKVLVALDFHSARIERFLDWRPQGRLPMGTQGDHVLLGKNEESNTAISHVYEENKPQLNMKRTSAKDTQSIRLHEGTIILETREENS